MNQYTCNNWGRQGKAINFICVSPNELSLSSSSRFVWLVIVLRRRRAHRRRGTSSSQVGGGTGCRQPRCHQRIVSPLPRSDIWACLGYRRHSRFCPSHWEGYVVGIVVCWVGVAALRRVAFGLFAWAIEGHGVKGVARVGEVR